MFPEQYENVSFSVRTGPEGLKLVCLRGELISMQCLLLKAH